jgi:hypothetical protein
MMPSDGEVQMKRWMRFLCLIVVALLTLMLSGCGLLTGDSSGSSGDTVGDGPPVICFEAPLRKSDVQRVAWPSYSPDEQKRQAEVCQRVAQEYTDLGYRIVVTTQGPESGDLVDCVDKYSVADALDPPPPPLPVELPADVQPQLMEVDVHPEMRCPTDTIPFTRPSFSGYVFGDTGATSLDDWIQNYQVVGVPGAQYRLYAGMATVAPNQGGDVSINAFGGDIEPKTMSVLEMVVGCRQNGVMWQQVGIAASRDKMNYNRRKGGTMNDGRLRLQVEFLTAGDTSTGPKHGGWHNLTTVSDFKPPTWRPYSPDVAFAASTISTPGVLPQYESRYYIQNFNGNWWVGINGYWLGYYPAELFGTGPSNLFATQACEVDWYGEVAAYATTPWTTTDIGSGHFAAEGFGYATYFRDPFYVGIDAAKTSHWLDEDPKLLGDVSPSVTACYSKSPLQSGNAPWDRFFFADGTGGDLDGCQYPP